MARKDPRSALDRTALREFRALTDELAARATEAYSCFGPEAVAFEHKEDHSRVTRLDLELESEWREAIRRRFPAHSIVGEEYGVDTCDPDFCWYLDPVDGTDDLTRGIPLYGFIVALYYRGLPLVGTVGHPALALRATALFGEGTSVDGRRVPPFRERKSADPAIAIPALDDFLRDRDESGVYLRLSRHFPNSRTYRTVFAHIAVLTGALDAALEFDVAEWDLAATRLLIEEAGGSFREFRRHAGPGGVHRLGAVFGSPELVSVIHPLVSGGG